MDWDKIIRSAVVREMAPPCQRTVLSDYRAPVGLLMGGLEGT